MSRRGGRRARHANEVVPGAPPAFDPATLPLALWVRGSYSGSPWSGTASTGGSGSKSLSEGTNAPATGSAVNGYTPADYDGTNDILGNSSDFKTTFMSVTAMTFIALVYVDSLGSDASGFAEEVVIGDSGGWVSMNLSASGTRIYVWDTGEKNSPYTAVSTGAWTMIVGKLDGGNLYSKVNGGSWSSGTGCGSAGIPASQTLISGKNVSGSSFLDAKILEIMAAPSVISDANLDNIRSGYFNTRYALSL